MDYLNENEVLEAIKNGKEMTVTVEGKTYGVIAKKESNEAPDVWMKKARTQFPPKEVLFHGYEVPEQLQDFVIKIMKRFVISGLCDGMYIANTIAYQNGIGDGMGNFYTEDFRIRDLKYPEETARHLQKAYGWNIRPDDEEELLRMFEIEGFDYEYATMYGFNDYICNCEDALAAADELRTAYLHKEIALAKALLQEVEEDCEKEWQKEWHEDEEDAYTSVLCIDCPFGNGCGGCAVPYCQFQDEDGNIMKDRPTTAEWVMSPNYVGD